MTNLFKKTLVAAAVMATTATSAYAATLTVGAGSEISKEGAASEASIPLPAVTITLGDEYAVNDRLVLRVTGAEVESISGATLEDASGVIQFGRLASTNPNEAVFRITSIGLDGDGNTLPTTGIDLDLEGITLDTDSVVTDAGDVSVTFQGRLADGTVVETSDAATAIEVTTQFALGTVTPLSATIDVNSDRQAFTADGASTSTTSDTLGIGFTEVTGLTFAATATTVTHTLFGDFSFVDTDGDGEAEISFSAVAGDDTFSAEFDDTFTAVTLTQGVVGSLDDATVTVNVPGQADGNPTIEAQDFTATVTLSYSDAQAEAGNSVLANGAGVGTWDLNGAQVFAPYIPVNISNARTTVVLSNTGSQNGEIEVEAFDESGMSYGPVSLGQTLAAGSVLRVRDFQIAEALGITDFEALSVTFTINAPADDVEATGFTLSAQGRTVIDIE